MATPLSDAELLDNIRPIVFVLDEAGTILQHAGTSVEIVGRRVEDMIGTCALDYVSPRHLAPMLFVFNGPGGHVVRNRHRSFPLEMIAGDGSPFLADCSADRVLRNGETLWVVTLMPHCLHSASFHAMNDYARDLPPVEIASTIAARLAWDWDHLLDTRSFVLSTDDDGKFTTVNEPQVTAAPNPLLTALQHHVGDEAPWNRSDDLLRNGHVTVPLGGLPPAVADSASAAGFHNANIAMAYLDDAPSICLVTFGTHLHAFDGNLNLIIADAISTLELALRREDAEVRLRHLADTDALTGLSNRRSFDRSMRTAQDSQRSALLYVDLDEFKHVNDRFGHQAGDAVLIEVGERIRRACRPFDTVARLGGDEFAVVLNDVDEHEAIAIAERVVAQIAEPLPEHFGPASVSASAGLSIGPLSTSAIEQADLAMLDGKRTEHGRLVVG